MRRAGAVVRWPRRRWIAVLVPVALALWLLVARWALSWASSSCRLLDSQQDACEPPFARADLPSALSFELTVSPARGGDLWARFAVVNRTTDARAIVRSDVRLVGSDGRTIDCLWGDDSDPRLETPPGRTTNEVWCDVHEDRSLQLRFQGALVATWERPADS